jgi:acetylserotonin N-methyltransferase
MLPDLDPLPLLRARDGIYAPDLLIAAVAEYDFFERLSGKAWTTPEMASLFGIAERPLDVMLTLFCAMDLLHRDGNTCRLSRRSEAFLTHQSQWDLGPYFASLKLRPQVREIVSVLANDRPANWESSAANQDWATSMGDDAFARRFTAAMNGRGEWLGPSLADSLALEEATALLDIGGGSGVYARVLQERYPHLRLGVLERPPVDQVARKYLGSTEAGRRVAVLAGDMFGAIPVGFDVHLFSNVLHDWRAAQVRQLLSRSRASLPRGGLIAVHDAFIHRDKQGPLAIAEYSVLLMLLSEGQCYSIGEMEAFLLDAGFSDVRHRDTTADRGVMTARVP